MKKCEMLKDKVTTWKKANNGGNRFTFQQDSLLAHKAKKTLDLLKEENVDFWSLQTYPSSSNDLNPMDYIF
uniref:Putative LOC101237786 [Hydra vulgaris] n=1 Tax=Lepeophtheirus salmonis TaxID=72036 RepID=A0A0K2U3D9_LEPSM